MILLSQATNAFRTYCLFKYWAWKYRPFCLVWCIRFWWEKRKRLVGALCTPGEWVVFSPPHFYFLLRQSCLSDFPEFVYWTFSSPSPPPTSLSLGKRGLEWWRGPWREVCQSGAALQSSTWQRTSYSSEIRRKQGSTSANGTPPPQFCQTLPAAAAGTLSSWEVPKLSQCPRGSPRKPCLESGLCCIHWCHEGRSSES